MCAGQDGFRDTSSKQKGDLTGGHWSYRSVPRRGSIDHTICSLSCKFWHRLSTVAIQPLPVSGRSLVRLPGRRAQISLWVSPVTSTSIGCVSCRSRKVECCTGRIVRPVIALRNETQWKLTVSRPRVPKRRLRPWRRRPPLSASSSRRCAPSCWPAPRRPTSVIGACEEQQARATPCRRAEPVGSPR